MRCSQKTTGLSYNTVNTENICSLWIVDWPTEQCAQYTKTIHRVLVYHTLLIGLLFLYVNIYHV